MNILFITSNRIGDAILSTGILEKTLESYPHAQVTVAAGPLALPLFTHIPGLINLWSFPKEPYGLHWGRLWKKSLSYKWDLIIDIRGSLITSFLRRRNAVVWRSQNPTLHKVTSLGNLMGFTPPPGPLIRISSQEALLAKNSLPSSYPIIAFGLGANWAGKVWPVERFAALAEKIVSSQGLFPQGRFLLLGSPSEKNLGTLFKTHLSPDFHDRIINKMGDLNLLETSGFLRKASVFIGNDSGLMHLAAASSTPTLGLFGPSNPIHYHPWGDHTHYIQTDIPYETLWAQRHSLSPLDTLMTSLSVDKVYDGLISLLKKGGV